MTISVNDINPETGRDRQGRFAKGNQCMPRKKRKPVEISADVREYADNNNLTLMATQMLEKIAMNQRNAYETKDQIKACDLLIKQFGIAVEKDLDREVQESTNETVADMLNILKKAK
ncbi:hypothetical protein BN1222_03585 [Klebsiella quasipneumoniae]|uniref:hypothetical protein n=1 Tax=Klebsiella quasipneumoniae TaxID=1463165 RepID=UPI0005E7E466|nr:hypothetical protein [Klebsiella quasipneumoniae]CEL82323.1 hypothetical protein BN1222_03585 [Klebsiella quasipneumoniae]